MMQTTDEKQQSLLCDFLGSYITENKRQKIEAALRYRTRHFTVVLEDIYQPHNASAVLRTCECLGIQDIHIIENQNRYRPNPGVAMGSYKWLNLLHYTAPNKPETPSDTQATQNTRSCLHLLRKKGYTIVATSPRSNAFRPDDFPLEKKAAFLFGSEEPGLSRIAFDEADAEITIPMFGFTESYNISVSVALVMSRLIERLHNSGFPYELPEAEKTELRLQWYRRIVKRHELLERRFREEQSNNPKPGK